MKEGDRVVEGDELCEVQSDKVLTCDKISPLNQYLKLRQLGAVFMRGGYKKYSPPYQTPFWEIPL